MKVQYMKKASWKGPKWWNAPGLAHSSKYKQIYYDSSITDNIPEPIQDNV